MGRGWKRARKLSTAPVPYPTIVLQVDQTAFANQGVLWDQRECCEDPNLDRGVGLRAGRDHPQATRAGGKPLPNSTDFKRDAFRENADSTGTSGVRLRERFTLFRQPIDSIRLVAGH